MSVDAREHPVGTIADLVDRAIDRAPGKTWLYFRDREYTYGTLRPEIARRAASLVDAGVVPGDRVLLSLPNTPEHIFTWLATVRVGAISVAVNPAASATELCAIAEQARAAIMVVDPQRRGELVAQLRGVVPADRVLSEPELTSGSTELALPQCATSGDVATLIATSGTTSRPKLVMQSHRTYVLTAEGFPSWLGLSQDDVLMAALPLFHLNAQVYSVLGSLVAGASLSLVERFSARHFWDDVAAHGCTQLNAMGAMLEILMRQPSSGREHASSLRLCYSAPAPSRERHLEIEERLGLTLISGYGLSESPFGMIWPLDGPRPYGALGYPRQHPYRHEVRNEAKVVSESGSEVQRGEVGELLLQNPATMVGYFGDADATQAVFEGGWLRTGDLVRQDDAGCFFFVSRKKDIIRRRGENIAAAHVEAAICAHDAVVEAAVVAVPSELSDEDVKAFVVRADEALSAAELHAWCCEQLSRFQVPRYIEFVDSLPHTPTGRLSKHQLPRDRRPSEHDLLSDDPSAASRVPST